MLYMRPHVLSYRSRGSKLLIGIFLPLVNEPSRAHACCGEMYCGRRKGWSDEDQGLSFLYAIMHPPPDWVMDVGSRASGKESMFTSWLFAW